MPRQKGFASAERKMNTVSKTAIIAIIFFCGLVVGSFVTNIASAASEQDKDIFKRNKANLSTEPDGWSVRALTNLMLDLTQAANGHGEPRRARSEAKAVLEELVNLNIASENKERAYLQASRFFEKLEDYVIRRKHDKNAVESCRAASRLFKALSVMENDDLPEKLQEKEGANFFYALSDILELERKDEELERPTKGEISLFVSLGDICKAESSDSDKDSRKALAKMFRALGTIATEDK